ncbi:virB8 family protein [Caulobacter sp. KR2-114]|uniref:virB8 family protein n=1 Tax=Caulobacter sp. KR2-114 TaxID=3400912 RepID=UPI003C09B6A7
MSDEREAYYAKAATWAFDEQAGARRMLRQTRVFAAVAAVVAILEALAILMLTPLKSVTAVPILVDRQTGFVEVLKPDGRKELTPNAALTESFLAQYVIARESFDIASIARDYHKVALWSGGGARDDYLAATVASNPQSPLKLYPRSTVVETRVKSISPIGATTALVRFETRRHDQDGRQAPPQAWAAVVGYRYVDGPMSVEDRFVNPLGFQVVRYHRDPEALEPETPAAPAAEAPAQTAATAAPAAGATAAPAGPFGAGSAPRPHP